MDSHGRAVEEAVPEVEETSIRKAIIGAGMGIGKIGGSATEAIARQPEAGPRIFTTMIIAAALIEGATLFALVICLIR